MGDFATTDTKAPVLLCFDGSDDAAAAIAAAGEMLAPRTGLVLTVWEPVASWEPYDPGDDTERAPVEARVERLRSRRDHA